MFSTSFQRSLVAFTLLLCCLTFTSHTSAMGIPEPSSEPIPDPMPPTTKLQLFLSEAGKLPLSENPITPFKQHPICPTDYPSGFTVRCEVSNAEKVLWRVRGQLFKTEYHAPYYLNGNWRDRVTAFSGIDALKKGQRVRIACLVPSQPIAWVYLIKSCWAWRKEFALMYKQFFRFGLWVELVVFKHQFKRTVPVTKIIKMVNILVSTNLLCNHNKLYDAKNIRTWFCLCIVLLIFSKVIEVLISNIHSKHKNTRIYFWNTSQIMQFF